MAKSSKSARKPKAILMGWINKGRTPRCGETVKNQQIISRLQDSGCSVVTLDFFRWKRHPWVVGKFFWSLLTMPGVPLILSTAPKNVTFVMKWHKRLGSKRPIVHWVIGGNLHKLAAQGEIPADLLNSLHVNIVESQEMLAGLKEAGVKNAVLLPNFKAMPYMPPLAKTEGAPVKFVFLSRIKDVKGVDYIFEAVRRLNAQGLKFSVDFYGEIAKGYEETFYKGVGELPNVEYKGFLQLQDAKNYDVLSQYSAMLLPTYWKSEGFAGVFVDSFIAGVPVIASDWAHNAKIIDHGKTGIIVPVHDAEALAQAMAKVINGEVDLMAMRKACQDKAPQYDVKNVVTDRFLSDIGLI